MNYRYFIKLAYNGNPFSGWQRQPNALTVQEVLEKALQLQVKDSSSLTGCGRTDTGVHAHEFFAHFDCGRAFHASEREQLAYQLNKMLPPEIALDRIMPVYGDAHARFSALSRTYEYHVLRKKDPFLFPNALYYNLPLDLDKMNAACRILLRTTDFECFSKVHTDVNHFHCRLERCFWKEENNLLIFTVEADRFLRNMVRAMVGTLIDIGRGKTSLEELERILKSRDRCRAGTSVFAGGLFLVKISYPDTIWSPVPVLKSEF